MPSISNITPGQVLGNAPRKFFAGSVAKWKVNKPEQKKTILGMPSY